MAGRTTRPFKVGREGSAWFDIAGYNLYGVADDSTSEADRKSYPRPGPVERVSLMRAVSFIVSQFRRNPMGDAIFHSQFQYVSASPGGRGEGNHDLVLLGLNTHSSGTDVLVHRATRQQRQSVCCCDWSLARCLWLMRPSVSIELTLSHQTVELSQSEQTLSRPCARAHGGRRARSRAGGG
jgi:hypothetical protein